MPKVNFSLSEITFISKKIIHYDTKKGVETLRGDKVHFICMFFVSFSDVVYEKLHTKIINEMMRINRMFPGLD